MARTIVRRVAELVTVAFAISLLTFAAGSKLPGDPAVTLLGPHHPPEDYATMRSELGLDRPLPERYWAWVSDAFHGDLGRSLLPPRPEVTSQLSAAFPVSIELCVLATIFALIAALLMALLSVRRPDGITDRLVTSVSFLCISTPEFLAGLVLILLFVADGGYFPRLGWVPISESPTENLKHAFLPALALAIPSAAYFSQVLRNDLIATLREDYILAARATGEAPWRTLVTGALRPSLLSFLTVVGVSLGYLIGGTAVVETLFGLPGVGSLLVKAAGGGDVPVIVALVVVLALMFVVTNALIDFAYTLLDPRIRHASK